MHFIALRQIINAWISRSDWSWWSAYLKDRNKCKSKYPDSPKFIRIDLLLMDKESRKYNIEYLWYLNSDSTHYCTVSVMRNGDILVITVSVSTTYNIYRLYTRVRPRWILNEPMQSKNHRSFYNSPMFTLTCKTYFWHGKLIDMNSFLATKHA